MAGYVKNIISIALAFFATLVFLGFSEVAEAGGISVFSDTISNSAPSATSTDHTIQFTVATAVPPSGKVIITPESGAFTIPASFLYTNVELLVSSGGGGFVSRESTSTPSATQDGVAVTTGTSGNVTITLNSTTGIGSGDTLRILLGDHASSAATTTSTGITNASSQGSYKVYAETTDAGSTRLDNGNTIVAMVDQVTVGPGDTTEEIPPFRFNGLPSGEIGAFTFSVEISLETDEFATCKYGTVASTSYDSLPFTFSSTGSVFHSEIIGGLVEETTYTYYVRCTDDEGNKNIDDYIISFTTPAEPSGNSGDPDDNNGGGEGTGTGDSGSGSGSSGGSGGGGGSGGSGGGGSGGSGGSEDPGGSGGFEDDDEEFQSDFGRVIIAGTSYPGSQVTILKDGNVEGTVAASTGSGGFTLTIDNVPSGSHTFGAYATDANGNKSNTYSTTFTVTGGTNSTVSGINIAPTVVATPESVSPGGVVTVSGYAIRGSTVNVETQKTSGLVTLSDVVKFQTTADNGGQWSVSVNTAGFEIDTWKVRAQSVLTASESLFSDFTFYGVGTEIDPNLQRSTDLNQDGFVNLIDFSILLFWWGTNGGDSNPPADINGDGNVSLVDFSIMIFDWTG